MPHIAIAADPRHWIVGTSITRDPHGEYPWWHIGPLAVCWG